MFFKKHLECGINELGEWIIGIYLHECTNNELEIFNTALGVLVRDLNFSFIVSELVQVNPDNSLAECVNL